MTAPLIPLIPDIASLTDPESALPALPSVAFCGFVLAATPALTLFPRHDAHTDSSCKRLLQQKCHGRVSVPSDDGKLLAP